SDFGAALVVAASDLVSDLVSDEGSDLASALASGFLSAVAGFEPWRKSVWYQPLPLSWKPGAVNFFASAGSPHAGQSTRAGSLSFCSASSSCPQRAQR